MRGKSSIFQSVLRLVHVHDGDIKVEGKSIYKQDINKYRSQFAVVTQDAPVFSGTIRYNLIFSNKKDKDDELKRLLVSAGLQLDIDDHISSNQHDISPGELQLLSVI